MEVKTLEIRDRATFIPVVAVRLSGRDVPEEYLLRRAGWYGREFVLLTELNGLRNNVFPYYWDDRTYSTAHKYIIEYWDEIENGQVIDVEFILGETDKPKVSEFYNV